MTSIPDVLSSSFWALAKRFKKTNKKHFPKKQKQKPKKHKQQKNKVGLLCFFLFYLSNFFALFFFFFFCNFIFLVCSSICWAVAFIRLVCHVGMCWWIALWNSVWTICEVNQRISDLGLPSTVGISCFFLPNQDFLCGTEQHLPPKKKWILLGGWHLQPLAASTEQF